MLIQSYPTNTPSEITPPKGVFTHPTKGQQTPTSQPEYQDALHPKITKSTVDQLNKELKALTSNSLQFSLDEKSGEQIIKLIDNQTKEVIRQIPSEEVLQIHRAIKELQTNLTGETNSTTMPGLLLKSKA